MVTHQIEPWWHQGSKFPEAGDVSLAWDPSSSPGILSYKVYIGQVSRTYTETREAGTWTAFVVKDLSARTWFFAVTAYDVEGSESDFSNEVSAVIRKSRD
jgi:hypothetical protein